MRCDGRPIGNRPPNLLISSAGAKVLLVEAFRAAAAPFDAKVVACDIDPASPALFAADRGLVVPETRDPNFARRFVELCRAHGIALVVPTRDGEMAALGALTQALASFGCRVLAPSPATLQICQDKRLFNQFCRANGFPVAREYAPDQVPRFPAFIRPAFGAGGVGAQAVESEAAWHALGAERRAGSVTQDLIRAPEYTIDALLDLEGRPLQAVVRRRIAVRAGEAVKSRVEEIPALADLALRLTAKLGCVGHNVVQAFYEPAKGAHLIEVNPRFGGASNLSIVAGLDSPRRILELLTGQEEAARRARPIRTGLTMLRFAQDRIVEWDALDGLARAM